MTDVFVIVMSQISHFGVHLVEKYVMSSNTCRI